MDKLVFGAAIIAGWFLFIYNWPRLLLYAFRRAILVQGFGDGPVPVNTLYVERQEFFADPLHVPESASSLMTTGVNRDTLLSAGLLDLRKGPQILRVPDMAGRYYSVQFTDASKNVNFAYVGTRTTGSGAGTYLISGPGWHGDVPAGVTQIAAPHHAVFVFGRVFVENDRDLPTAYALSKQIELSPLSQP